MKSLSPITARPVKRDRSADKMKYISLLKKELKSDEILELLETYDMEVIYEFDRTHENLPDKYWTKCLDLGIQIVFDGKQSLNTIFVNLTDEEGFTPVDLSESDILHFESKKDAAFYAKKEGIAISEGKTEFMGVERDWIRFENEGYSIHYEFRNGFLGLVTITAN